MSVPIFSFAITAAAALVIARSGAMTDPTLFLKGCEMTPKNKAFTSVAKPKTVTAMNYLRHSYIISTSMAVLTLHCPGGMALVAVLQIKHTHTSLAAVRSNMLQWVFYTASNFTYRHHVPEKQSIWSFTLWFSHKFILLQCLNMERTPAFVLFFFFLLLDSHEFHLLVFSVFRPTHHANVVKESRLWKWRADFTTSIQTYSAILCLTFRGRWTSYRLIRAWRGGALNTTEEYCCVTFAVEVGSRGWECRHSRVISVRENKMFWERSTRLLVAIVSCTTAQQNFWLLHIWIRLIEQTADFWSITWTEEVKGTRISSVWFLKNVGAGASTSQGRGAGWA